MATKKNKKVYSAKKPTKKLIKQLKEPLVLMFDAHARDLLDSKIKHAPGSSSIMDSIIPKINVTKDGHGISPECTICRRPYPKSKK